MQARCVQLLTCLGAVPAVGDEKPAAGSGDQEHGGRAGETGEIADVRQCRDEQRIHPGTVEPRLQARHSVREVHRCEGRVRIDPRVTRAGVAGTGGRPRAGHVVSEERTASNRAAAWTANG